MRITNKSKNTLFHYGNNYAKSSKKYNNNFPLHEIKIIKVKEHNSHTTNLNNEKIINKNLIKNISIIMI